MFLYFSATIISIQRVRWTIWFWQRAVSIGSDVFCSLKEIQNRILLLVWYFSHLSIIRKLKHREHSPSRWNIKGKHLHRTEPSIRACEEEQRAGCSRVIQFVSKDQGKGNPTEESFLFSRLLHWFQELLLYESADQISPFSLLIFQLFLIFFTYSPFFSVINQCSEWLSQWKLQ